MLQNVKAELAAAAAQREAEKERLLDENRSSGESDIFRKAEEVSYPEGTKEPESVYFIDESADDDFAENAAEIYSDAAPEDEFSEDDIIDPDSLKEPASDDDKEDDAGGVIGELNRRFGGISHKAEDSGDNGEDGDVSEK